MIVVGVPESCALHHVQTVTTRYLGWWVASSGDMVLVARSATEVFEVLATGLE